MKTLYLVRHAKSSWADPALNDFDRPLNKRGFKDAPLMADIFKTAKIKPELIISSPALRAATTAEIISGKIEYSKTDINFDMQIYDGSVNGLLNLIRKINNLYGRVMLFGHNPGFTELANYLGNSAISNLPTCGVYAIQFAVHKWKDVGKSGKTILIDFPKNHK